MTHVAHVFEDCVGSHVSSFELERTDKPRRVIFESRLGVAEEAKHPSADSKAVGEEREVALSDEVLHVDVEVVAVLFEILLANRDSKEALGSLVAAKSRVGLIREGSFELESAARKEKNQPDPFGVDKSLTSASRRRVGTRKPDPPSFESRHESPPYVNRRVAPLPSSLA